MSASETHRKIEIVTQLVLTELLRAQRLHPPLASNHEAKGVIDEELKEWFDEVIAVKSSHGESDELTKEGTHLAAMAMRFLVDRVSIGLLTARLDYVTRRELRDAEQQQPTGEPAREFGG